MDAARVGAVVDLFRARAHYYLKAVGVDRCVFEIDHLPLVLRNEREHLVEQGFWTRAGMEHGLVPIADEPVGPPELGNFLVELTVA